MEKQRITYYDSLKFVLVIFVIIGHSLLFDERDDDFKMKSTWYFIYLFHMPLFVSVSGYFHKKFDWQSSKKSVFKILETYLVFHLFWFVVEADFSLYALLKPSWTLWYLLSLVWWRMIATYLVPRFKAKYLLFFSVLLSFCFGFIPLDWGGGEILSISRTIVYFPFYLLGVYATHQQVMKIRELPKIIAFLVIAVSIGFVTSDYAHDFDNLRFLLWGSKHFSAIGSDLIDVCSMELITLVFTVLLSVSVIRLIPDFKVFSKLGNDSLFFYIYHVFLIKFYRFILYRYLKLEPDYYSMLLVAGLVIISLLLMLKVPLLKKMLNPYTSFIKKK